MSDELVTVTVDGKEVKVPKGTNLIEAAKSVDVDVPFYCYHPHLSVPGNCRMCQLEVEGAPKLMIGCHTQVQEGMVIKTQHTSEQVKAAQASTLEMILINHPLDCTVCDQAGHCKLQDYHYEYNAKPSRFLEEKEHKPKAVPLGETVMLDAERCIACTRCVRFCDEVTGTGEIGLVNRGDRVTIAVKEGHELSNALSGTVVDLCPVGALTHKKWRFNTRIWYTKATESICPGCSTGCNVKVYERDGAVVQVKGRMNDEVNKEWLCDEGRYGFGRFLPRERLHTSVVREGGALQEVEPEEIYKKITAVAAEKTLILAAPDLLVEEYALLAALREKALPGSTVALAYKERTLSDVEKILVSPDYAANYQGAIFSRLTGEGVAADYQKAISALKAGSYEQVILIGDRALCEEEQGDSAVLDALKGVATIGMLTDLRSPLLAVASAALPGRSILEKSGLLINRALRVQYSAQVVPFPDSTQPEWRMIGAIAKALGQEIVDARTDRDLTLSYLAAEPRVRGLSIAGIKNGGVCLKSYQPGSGQDAADARG